MTTARNDMADVATARSNVYGLLAAVFRAEPSATFLAGLRAPEFKDALESLGLPMKDGFSATPCNELAEDLAIEFTRLFVGPGPHISPHESTNIEFENAMEAALWGPQTVKVKKFVEATGLEYDDAFTGMPDHISAEFELMQQLAIREAEAWAAQDESVAETILKIEQRFLDEHLSQWASRFCDTVIEVSRHPFYRGFSELTKRFLEYEDRTIRAFVAEPRNGADASA
jgi:TorA maturation chaperone TorD